MARTGFQFLLKSVVVCTLLGLATTGIAEIRSKSPGTSATKSTPAKKGTDLAAQAKPQNGPGGAVGDDPMADNDSPKGKSSGTGAKDNLKKKTARKSAKDPKAKTGSRSGRPRMAEGLPDPQVLVGADLNLEPET